MFNFKIFNKKKKTREELEEPKQEDNAQELEVSKFVTN